MRQLVTRTDAVTERRLQLDTGPVHVQADPTMVERMVDNLLANAVKHTPGDSRIWVRVERTDEGGRSPSRTTGPASPSRIASGSSSRSLRTPGPGPGAPASAWPSSPAAALHDGPDLGPGAAGGGSSFRVLLAFEPVVEDVVVVTDDERATPR